MNKTNSTGSLVSPPVIEYTNINIRDITAYTKYIINIAPIIPHTLPLVNFVSINMISGTIKDSMPSVLYMYRLNIFYFI